MDYIFFDSEKKFTFNLDSIDIIDCIEIQVNKIAKGLYSEDSCKPIFKVSVLWLNKEQQQLILNCSHLGRTFSRVLFPKEECFWEYDSLQSLMTDLYNQTM